MSPDRWHGWDIEEGDSGVKGAPLAGKKPFLCGCGGGGLLGTDE